VASSNGARRRQQSGSGKHLPPPTAPDRSGRHSSVGTNSLSLTLRLRCLHGRQAVMSFLSPAMDEDDEDVFDILGLLSAAAVAVGGAAGPGPPSDEALPSVGRAGIMLKRYGTGCGAASVAIRGRRPHKTRWRAAFYPWLCCDRRKNRQCRLPGGALDAPTPQQKRGRRRRLRRASKARLINYPGFLV
jgi:hypothetical protein